MHQLFPIEQINQIGGYEMKSKDFEEKTKELEEKTKKAAELEEMIHRAIDAEMMVDSLLHDLERVNIAEPQGWLSSIMSELVSQLEAELERL